MYVQRTCSMHSVPAQHVQYTQGAYKVPTTYNTIRTTNQRTTYVQRTTVGIQYVQRISFVWSVHKTYHIVRTVPQPHLLLVDHVRIAYQLRRMSRFISRGIYYLPHEAVMNSGFVVIIQNVLTVYVTYIHCVQRTNFSTCSTYNVPASSDEPLHSTRH